MSRVAEGVVDERMASEGKGENAALGDHGSERHSDDVDHGARDPAEDEAVHEQTEIDGFKSAEEGGGLAGIANLDEFDVGENFGTAPVAREEENGGHAGEAQAPPDPVAGDTLGGDESADEEGRVGGEGGGHHRGAGKPPGDIAAGDEKVFSGTAGFAAVVDADEQVEEQVGSDNEPVEMRKRHAVPEGASLQTSIDSENRAKVRRSEGRL